jgi:FtsP/CotA-like multicopper oxidase with cupredoxin domain
MVPALAFALAMGACAAASVAPAGRRMQAAAAAPLPPTDTLVSPRVVATGPNGILDVVLDVVMDSLQVPLTSSTSGNQYLRAYKLIAANGVTYDDPPAFPGPTFVVSPGDSVRILLRNQLPPGASNDVCMPYPASQNNVDEFQDCFHGPNWTNIHYHGFHVTPDSTGDDVLLQIAPGQTYQYAFGIPFNQSPGTHWYHPHKHGSVAVQVSNGMSGAFIVRGGALDLMLDSMDVQERLLAIQKVDSQLNLVDTSFQGVTTLNGQITPTIRMRPNEVQRWRVVNENITRTTNFQVGFVDLAGNEPTLFDVARDGVQYSPLNYNLDNSDTLLLMAPGNRLDVLVQAPATVGVHLFTAESVAPPAPGGSRKEEGPATANPADTLFFVEVVPAGSTPYATTLPQQLPPLPSFLANLPGVGDSFDADTVPLIVFMDSTPRPRNKANPSQFWLGTAANPRMRFNDTVVYIPQTVQAMGRPMILGGIQTWIVANYGTTTNHPFHIHINPFQVAQVVFPRGGADPNAAFYAELNMAAQKGAPIWLDVLALPLPRVDSVGGQPTDTVPGYIVIRQQYDDFSGQYVMHCHILGHEERGMMQLLQVFPTLQDAQRAASAGGGAHGGHGTARAAPGSGAGGVRGAGNGTGGEPGSGQGRPHQH